LVPRLLLIRRLELCLMHLGQCAKCERRRDIGHHIVPQRNRKEIARVTKQTRKGSTRSATTLEKQDIRKYTSGSYQKMPTRNYKGNSEAANVHMDNSRSEETEYVLFTKLKFRNTVKEI